jgi:hypothetical protein
MIVIWGENDANSLIMKYLASSLVKVFAAGSLVICRRSAQLFFKIEKGNCHEIIEKDISKFGLLRAIGAIINKNMLQNDSVIFLKYNSICIRNPDHLKSLMIGEILTAPILEYVAKDSSRGMGGRNELPRFKFNDSIFAVRSCCLEDVLNNCLKIESDLSEFDNSSKFDIVWQKYLSLTKLRIKVFERDEIAFPAYGSTYQECEDAAIVCAEGWPESTQLSFLTGMYFSRFFGDAEGTFLNILEP